jgi:hypothetical protein
VLARWHGLSMSRARSASLTSFVTMSKRLSTSMTSATAATCTTSWSLSETKLDSKGIRMPELGGEPRCIKLLGRGASSSSSSKDGSTARGLLGGRLGARGVDFRNELMDVCLAGLRPGEAKHSVLGRWIGRGVDAVARVFDRNPYGCGVSNFALFFGDAIDCLRMANRVGFLRVFSRAGEEIRMTSSPLSSEMTIGSVGKDMAYRGPWPRRVYLI